MPIQIKMTRTDEAQLHTGNGRWYISYYYFNQQGKRVRKREYLQLNRIKDLQARMERARELLARIQAKLHHGYNPQLDRYASSRELTISGVLQQMLVTKKAYQKKRSFAATKYVTSGFLRFLFARKLEQLPPHQIKRGDIAEFLNEILLRGCSNRTYNDHLIDLNASFNFLIKQDIIEKNPCQGIRKLPSRSVTHLAYSDTELIRIKAWLESNDPYLGIFCKFIAYCFVRVDECRKIQLKHLDLEKSTLVVPQENEKTSRRRVKRIPEFFRQELLGLNLQGLDENNFLFSKKEIPGEESPGINFFTRRYKKLKKALKLSDQYTMYGLRHTYVSQLLKNGARWHDVMNLTGHTSMSAFERYANSLLGAEQKDLSSLITLKL